MALVTFSPSGRTQVCKHTALRVPNGAQSARREIPLKITQYFVLVLKQSLPQGATAELQCFTNDTRSRRFPIHSCVNSICRAPNGLGVRRLTGILICSPSHKGVITTFLAGAREIICPSCNYDNPADASLCEGCGTKLELICPACKASVSPGARFCNRPGARASTNHFCAAAERDFQAPIYPKVRVA